MSPYCKNFLGLLIFCLIPVLSSAQSTKWVGTWSTAPQLVEPHNNPPNPGLTNNSIRQIFKISIGGDSLRMRFTNEFSSSPVTMKEVHLALSTGADSIEQSTDTILLFNGEQEVTMDAGSYVMSDPFAFSVDSLSTLAVTIYFGQTSSDVSGHPGSRTTSYILTGNHSGDVTFLGSVNTDHWYVINTLEVLAPDTSAAVAILGDSITDGRGSGTNKQNRWPDELSKRLQANPGTGHVAVLNQGIGGNCVLGSCLGPSAQSRFHRDILDQSGIRWLIIMEGINDIGNGSPGTGDRLVEAFTQMTHAAHMRGIYVYGATLLPMKGSFYYSEAHEAERQIVNQWIRTTDLLDGYIDLDKALRNPSDTLSLLPEADDGDGLHPSETGHRMMAEAVDLALFTQSDSLEYEDNSQSLYYEAECGETGSDWDIVNDELASNGSYITVKSGVESLNNAPSTDDGLVSIVFSVDSSGTYSIYGRLNNPTYNDDSFWLKVDDGDFVLYNGLVTSGWNWVKFDDFTLSEGDHVLQIGYREDGATLDKISITNSFIAPSGMGDEAQNICSTTSIDHKPDTPDGYTLNQNYPNPFNPSTNIGYQLAETAHVELNIFDTMGRKVAELVNSRQTAGFHLLSFDAAGLASGIYFYRLETSSGFIESKKMILLM